MRAVPEVRQFRVGAVPEVRQFRVEAIPEVGEFRVGADAERLGVGADGVQFAVRVKLGAADGLDVLQRCDGDEPGSAARAAAAAAPALSLWAGGDTWLALCRYHNSGNDEGDSRSRLSG